MPRLSKKDQARKKAAQRQVRCQARKREARLMRVKIEIDPPVDWLLGFVSEHLGITKSQVVHDLIAENPHIPDLKFETIDVNQKWIEIELDDFDAKYLKSSKTLTAGDVVEHLVLSQCRLPVDRDLLKEDPRGMWVGSHQVRSRQLLYEHPGHEGAYLVDLFVVDLKGKESKYETRQKASQYGSDKLDIVELYRQDKADKALVKMQKVTEQAARKESRLAQKMRDEAALRCYHEEIRDETRYAARASQPHSTSRSTAWMGNSRETYEEGDDQ